MKRTGKSLTIGVVTGLAAASLVAAQVPAGAAESRGQWSLGEPIVTWYAGRPSLSDAAAEQMRAGGWNLVWCSEAELDVAQRHGLRAMLRDGLLSPATLDDPARRAALDALIGRVSKHPALYSYYLIDEPSASGFAGLGKLVAYLREKDPEHFAYINLFPTYANNDQLGTQGDTVTAYREHLRLYMETVKPDLISYDHYHFTANGDNDQYFLNLAMVRQAALDAEVPFLNIVQACTWTPTMRVPNARELRFLVYTTLAYGAQGLSYFVYSVYMDPAPSDRPLPGFSGGLVDQAGAPTSLGYAAKRLNREFVAIARELQPLRSLGAYHAGVVPGGGEALPQNSAFRLDPSASPAPTKGLLLGCFGKPSRPTHVLVVNLDYTSEVATTLIGPGPLEVFEATGGRWRPAGGTRVALKLRPGSGQLLRIVGG